jgi:DNA-binding response OmpR family regulator
MERTPAMRSRMLILIRDDAERASLMAALRQADYDVVAVGSAHDARGALRVGHFDLVLLDSCVPNRVSLQLCNELRERYGPRLVIIFICDATTPTCGISALELGADDYVVRPYATEELLARIDVRLLRHHVCSA